MDEMIVRRGDGELQWRVRQRLLLEAEIEASLRRLLGALPSWATLARCL